ncbi:MAG: biopolymer transporter ExbD [Bacteroides sp.]|nr:biopolymer transporter ExbD [Bacteroides sp.]MDE7449077.1 biopolymer transporter ExbD [Paramuribaculum sp.]
MGKVKIKRKSTLIDMTAMSDVTVLLLTFFMLTSTFLQKEPVTVITPSSVSEVKVPTANVATILVSPEGKVFISIAGDADPENKDTWGSEAIRMEVLQKAVAEYNRLHPGKKVELSQKDLETFSKMNMFGVPMAALPTFLNLSQTEQDKVISDMSRADVGIPIDDNKNLETPNEFQIWMRAIYSSGNDNLQAAMKKGEGIAVKADRGTPYSTVHHVLDNLQTLKMNRFSLMTALKTEQD